MIPNQLILGTLYFSQTVLGLLGNFMFLSFFIFTRRKLRPIEHIIAQLTLANFIFLIFKGIPMIIVSFGTRGFLDDSGCKVDFYLLRVSRGLILSITSLLSSFQAIIITPTGSPWEEVKGRAPKHIISCCLFCWLVNLLIEIGIIKGTKGSPSNTANVTVNIDLIFCSWENLMSHFVLLSSFRDAFLMALMMFTSGYMVILLRKHHQQVQYLHSHGPRLSPELRATRSILLLVSIFIFFYCTNCIFSIYQTYFLYSSDWLVNLSTFLVLCFPSISPFLLIHNIAQVTGVCCTPGGIHKPWPPI